MKKNKKIIIMNWKMNPVSEKEAKEIFIETKKVATKLNSTQTIICPPSLFIQGFTKNLKKGNFSVGAQDVFWNNKGSHTGEISPLMLRGLGVKYVILGHSERRLKGETSEVVNLKVKEAIKSGLVVILCIGESERDSDGRYLSFIRDEITKSLRGISKKNMKNVIMAYEPIWAVGKKSKRADNPENLFEMVIFIKKALSEIFGKEVAMKTLVLYGGSVNEKNTKEFLENGKVDGLLIGRASLQKEKIKEILKIANTA